MSDKKKIAADSASPPSTSAKEVKGNSTINTVRQHTTTQYLWKLRTADAVLSATGAAGSLILLQWIQDYLILTNYNMTTNIVGGFLGGSAIKFFLNQNPPTLEAFFKSTAASIVIGSSVHSLLWSYDDDTKTSTTIIPTEYSTHLILFLMILFWKLDVGSIWGAGNSLGMYLAYGSGFWGDISNKDFQSLMKDFPIVYILRPYLLGHLYLYLMALGMARIRRIVRITILRREHHIQEMGKDVIKLIGDRKKLRILFDRMDTSGDGRLDELELKLTLRCTVGEDITLEDCRYIIRSVDTDGDGKIDFDEFCASVEEILLL
jgi:hypothetical protein